MSAPPTPRRRESVFLVAEVVAPDRPVRRCRVRNLSDQGICIEQPQGLVRGNRVTVTVGLVVRALADVVWASDNFAGLHFVRPIDPTDARKRAPRSLDPREGWGRASAA